MYMLMKNHLAHPADNWLLSEENVWDGDKLWQIRSNMWAD